MEYVRKARLAPGWNSSESKNQDFWTLSQASLNWAFRWLFPEFLVKTAGDCMNFVQFIVPGLQVFLFPNCKNSIKWIWIFPLVHKLQNLFQLSQNTQLKKTLHFDFECMLLNMQWKTKHNLEPIPSKQNTQHILFQRKADFIKMPFFPPLNQQISAKCFASDELSFSWHEMSNPK